MSLDEAINQHCLAGVSPPTLRLYGWQQPAITIGRFQKNPPRIPLSGFSEVEIVRRITGGRAVRHDGDLTFSISARRNPSGTDEPDIPIRPREGFEAVAQLVQNAFRTLQIELEWGPPRTGPGGGPQNTPADCFFLTEAFELRFEGEKILGSAQKRWKNGMLQQGTIRMEPFRRHLGQNRFLELMKALPLEIKRAFEVYLGMEFSVQGLTGTEWDLALDLEKHRYRNPAWNTHGKLVKF